MRVPIAIVFLVLVACAACSAAAAQLECTVLDGGGGFSSSANYTLHGSMATGGFSADDVAVRVVRHGYLGQLTEIVELALEADPDEAPEEGTAQLGGAAVHHDGMRTLIRGTEVSWNASEWPLAAIDATGLATMGIVYQDTLATFSGSYRGVAGAGEMTVKDINPDNYGSYAGDGLPDWWQVLHFGFDNPDAHPAADPTRTRQNNLFRYIAGLDPNDAASLFVLDIRNVPGENQHKNLVYSPIAEGRTYILLVQTDLLSDEWSELQTGGAPVINGDTATVTDLQATEPAKFYGVVISLDD